MFVSFLNNGDMCIYVHIHECTIYLFQCYGKRIYTLYLYLGRKRHTRRDHLFFTTPQNWKVAQKCKINFECVLLKSTTCNIDTQNSFIHVMGAYHNETFDVFFFPSEKPRRNSTSKFGVAIVNLHLKCTTLWILGWSKFEVFCAPMCILDESVNPSTPLVCWPPPRFIQIQT